MENGVGNAHGSQHVGGFEGTGGARGTGGGADAFFIEHQENGFPFDVLEADIGRVGESLGGMPVDFNVADAIEQSPFEAIAQFPFSIDVLEMQSSQFCGFTQPDDAGNVLGTRSASPFLVTADEEGTEAEPAPHVEGTNAFGGVQFMTREGEQVDSTAAQVDGNFAHRLDGIDVEGSPVLFGDRSHFLDGENRAGFVVGVHHRHQGRTAGDGRF